MIHSEQKLSARSGNRVFLLTITDCVFVPLLAFGTD